jgi:hypothetical protein
LAATPPMGLYGATKISVNGPLTATDGQYSIIAVSVSLIGTSALNIIPTMLAGEALFPNIDIVNGLSFQCLGQCGSWYYVNSFDITFGTPAPPDSFSVTPYWRVHFQTAGDGVNYYSAPDDFIIYQLTIDTLLASASYSLDTSQPVVTIDAGFTLGATPNTGYATLDGSAQFLNPLNPSDNGPLTPPSQAVMPTVYGGTGYAFSVCAWVKLDSWNTLSSGRVNYPIISWFVFIKNLIYF